MRQKSVAVATAHTFLCILFTMVGKPLFGVFCKVHIHWIKIVLVAFCSPWPALWEGQLSFTFHMAEYIFLVSLGDDDTFFFIICCRLQQIGLGSFWWHCIPHGFPVEVDQGALPTHAYSAPFELNIFSLLAISSSIS